jgi:high-affinity iron transporter
MLTSLLIFAREGLEGTLLCTILLTYLAAANRRDLIRYVFAGAMLAIGVAALVGWLLWHLSQTAFLGSISQTWMETVVFALAVSVLTAMTFWMRRHSRTLSRDLRARVKVATTRGSGYSLGLLAFITVGREALEAVLFLLAIAYLNTAFQLTLGALLGLGLALGLSFAIYRLGQRINLGRFFALLGSLLLVVAAGLLADTIQNLQQLGVIPFTHQLWNLSPTLPDDRGLGDLLHGLVGYSSTPTLLQVVLWASFLGLFLTLFLRPFKPTLPTLTQPPAAAP